ncbi:MAG: hypothetical protein MI923_13900 [Phycisphaerales bacterium]|nr:hypothetical protein [Phycisphaerales bacterium]
MSVVRPSAQAGLDSNSGVRAKRRVVRVAADHDMVLTEPFFRCNCKVSSDNPPRSHSSLMRIGKRRTFPALSKVLPFGLDHGDYNESQVNAVGDAPASIGLGSQRPTTVN